MGPPCSTKSTRQRRLVKLMAEYALLLSSPSSSRESIMRPLQRHAVQVNIEQVTTDPAELVTALARTTAACSSEEEAALARKLFGSLRDTDADPAALAALLTTDVPGLLRWDAFNAIFRGHQLHLAELATPGVKPDRSALNYGSYLRQRVVAHRELDPAAHALAVTLSFDWSGTLESLLTTAAAMNHREQEQPRPAG